MRSIMIGMFSAASLLVVSTASATAAPANASALCKALADANPVIQARCWCTYRTFAGRCQRWRCR